MSIDLRRMPVGAAAIALWLVCTSCFDSGVSPKEEPGTDTPFKIVILGASTAKGQPYESRLDFGRLVKFLFDGKIAGRDVKVVNLALPGIFSRKILNVAEEIDSSADLVFLYSGNNEFLGFTGRTKEPHPKLTLFDRPTVSSKTRAETLKLFRKNLEATIRHMQSIGVPLIISTVAVNESDWWPNRSYLRDPGNEEQVARNLEDAEKAIAAEDFDRAVSILVKALEVEPTFAWTNKRLADVYRALGRYREAKRYYRNAIDYDGYPIRVLTEQNDAIKELAQIYDLPLVDAAKEVAELSPTGLVGYDLMWDNCHPRLEGYLAIAEAFAQRIETLFPAEAEREPRTLREVEEAFGVAQLEVGIYSARGQYLYGSSLFIWDPTARLARAKYYLDKAASLAPPSADLLSSMAILSALRKEPRASIEHWRRAFDARPKVASRRFEAPRAREAVERAGIEAAVARIQRDSSGR
jgi:lysophospholipase L1-like esterase